MPKTEIDTLSIADRLRPVLLQVGRELRREAREVGVSPEQVSLLVAIKYAPGTGVRELAARERVSPPALSNHIDRLERDGLVTRTVFPTIPPRVDYELTLLGSTLLDTIQALVAWAGEHGHEIAEARAAYDARGAANEPAVSAVS